MNLKMLHNQLESGSEAGARALLGWELVCIKNGVRTSGYIVEAEAYSQNDPASHTFTGQSDRNTAMFGLAGTIYVYFTYGMHYCVNIVTGKIGDGEAVLIRALQPKDGISTMMTRRNNVNLTQLTNGPAKLVSALNISDLDNGSTIGAGSIL